jgi:hypothetical protein
MIVIPIMLASAADGSRRALGSLVIVNDGTAITGDARSYNVTYFDGEGLGQREGRIESWPSESRPVLELVAAAIQSLSSKSVFQSGESQ